MKSLEPVGQTDEFTSGLERGATTAKHNKKEAGNGADARAQREQPTGFDLLGNREIGGCAAGIYSRSALGITQAHPTEIGLKPEDKILVLKIVAGLAAAGKTGGTQVLCSGGSNCRNTSGRKIAGRTEDRAGSRVRIAIGAADICAKIKALKIGRLGGARCGQGQDSNHT